MRKTTVLAAGLAFLVLLHLQPVFAQGTVLTYQGRLSQNGAPFTGFAEIAPTLWDAASGGNPVGTNNPVTLLVSVSNGLFSASLDFGSAPFTTGAARWLQLGVRTVEGPFTILSPLQPLTATPYAITAGYVTTAVTATSFSGPLAGNVTGTQGATVVSSVGGQTAAAVASGAVAANAATSVNTANTIVKRDGSGNFSAGAITAGSVSGNGASLTSLNAGNLASGTVPVARLSGVASNQLDAGTWFAATNLSGSINASNLASGTVPLGRLSGITSNQLDAGTWQFLVALASGIPAGMVLISGGSFTMGDTLDGGADAIPTNVYVSAFYMDTNLVSWSQWQGVYAYATAHGYGLNAGAGKAANHPVQTVDWYDCVKWCNARSQQAGKVPVYYTDAGLTQVYTNLEVTVYVNWGAKGYRLPTEAEWEKAARGGLSGQRFPWGNLISQTNANYYGDTGSYIYDLGPNGYNSIGLVGGVPYTSPVGSFAVNGYGLNDMAGNVWQWCWDWYGTPYAGGTDPRGAVSGSYRVYRGGSWRSRAFLCRAAGRGGNTPDYRRDDFGFRSVLTPGQ